MPAAANLDDSLQHTGLAQSLLTPSAGGNERCHEDGYDQPRQV